MNRAGLTSGLDRAGLAGGLKRSGPPTGLNRPEPKGRLNRPLSVVADDEDATGREAHEREWERRRAAGAAGSVFLAAAGMSDGLPEAPEEVAIPATTLLGVEEGDDLPAEQPGGAGAHLDAGDGDERFAHTGEGDEELSRTSGGYAETAQVDFDGVESARADFDNAESAQVDVDNAESVQDDRVESVQGDFDRVESAQADVDDAETAQLDAEGEQFQRSDADLAQTHAEGGQFPAAGDEILDATQSGEADLEAPDPPVAADETTASSDDEPSGDDVKRLVARPLGQAPLLDSKPLPATRPGMLRPRVPEERDSFSLPVQRPAFELGSDEPADIT